MSAQAAYIEISGSLASLYNDSLHMILTQSEIDTRINNITRRLRDMVSANRSTMAVDPINDAANALHMLRRRLAGPYTAPLVTQTVIRYNPAEKSKVISVKKLNEPCPDECAICQEQPKMKDAVCTECKHYFCKVCWTDWMNAPTGNKKCPTCRKDMPRVTSFKARANVKLSGPMSRPALIIEEDPEPDLFAQLFAEQGPVVEAPEPDLFAELGDPGF